MMASLMDDPLESETPRLTHAENLTTSQLNFTPSTHDQDKVLTCTAQNEVFPSVNRYVSMTQLLSHTFAHLTGSSFRLKAKLLPIKNILGVKYN